MNIEDIEQFFESWAPRWTAWDRDNVGLQVGDRARKVQRVLLALDLTPAVVREAISKKADLIITHHPLLFRPPSSITTSDPIGRIALALAEKKIALFSAHTNLDFTRGGVSFALANALGLRDVRFLSPLKETLAKISVFVPEKYVDQVTSAMSESGAGIIGHYHSCSFRVPGTGTFRASLEARPFVGKAGVFERVDEVRLEMLTPRARVNGVVAAMKRAHPYEEVAYDVYPLQNENPNFGMGAIGNLRRPVSLKALLATTKRVLGAEGLRYAGELRRTVKRIAVCGGSGSDLFHEALAAKADAFITADVRYHTFQAASDQIALIDAGHWETEQVILQPLAERLRGFAEQSGEKITITLTKHLTNPTHSF